MFGNLNLNRKQKKNVCKSKPKQKTGIYVWKSEPKQKTEIKMFANLNQNRNKRIIIKTMFLD